MTEDSSTSPKWGTGTKLVVAITFIAVILVVLISVRSMVGPLLMAFILAYLLFPLAERLRRLTRIPWRVIVAILFLIILFGFLGLLTWGGITVYDQVQSLIKFLQRAILDLPALLDQWSSTPIQIGNFTFDPINLDFDKLTQQILSAVQPFLSRLGVFISSVASGAASTIGWVFFILLVSFFVLSETRGSSKVLIGLSLPGYSQDLERIGQKLDQIWNAFLRGQLILFLLTVAVYTILLGALGVRFYFGLAILAGLARFVPYVGPAVAWTTYGLVALFQNSTLFGLQPFGYALLVVGIAWVTDSIMDSLVSNRLMSNALKVHPAAIMVAVIVAASVLGVVGVFLAAPVLATLKLFSNYIVRKLFDQDPWEQSDISPETRPFPSFPEIIQELRRRVAAIFARKKS